MDENDPRRETDLLRRLEESRLSVKEGIAPKAARRPPTRARCEACGSAMLSGLPTFSTGSGIAFRAFADDMICQRCGHIGPFVIE